MENITASSMKNLTSSEKCQTYKNWPYSLILRLFLKILITNWSYCCTIRESYLFCEIVRPLFNCRFVRNQSVLSPIKIYPRRIRFVVTYKQVVCDIRNPQWFSSFVPVMGDLTSYQMMKMFWTGKWLHTLYTSYWNISTDS